MDVRKALGQHGETLAVNYLETHGYIVVDRNVALKRGEIDIIARQGGDLVFIEVKTRSNADFGTPAEAVTPAKAKKIALGAREYLYANLLTNIPVRCDVVSVMMPPQGQAEIELIRNAIDLGEALGAERA